MRSTNDEFLDATATRVLAVDRPLARRAAHLRARHRSLRSATRSRSQPQSNTTPS